MKFRTTQTKETEIEIPIPSFWKDANCHESIRDYRAILDEKTYCHVWESERRTMIENSDIDLMDSNIIEAHLKWQPVPEDEFMYHYNRALHSLSLNPELITNNNPVL